jgi:hypothetical protein
MTISFVTGQSTSNGISAASLTLTLPNNPTVGNLVCVALQCSSGTTYTVADSNGNNYTSTPAGPVTENGGAGIAQIFYLRNAPANASKSVIVTAGSGTPTIVGEVFEFSGADTTSSPIDVEVTHNSATSQTNINDPTITSGKDGELLFFTCTALGGAMTAINSPWTGLFAFGGTGTAGGYFIQPTHGSQAISLTQTSAGAWAAIITAFKIPSHNLSLMGVGQ